MFLTPPPKRRCAFRIGFDNDLLTGTKAVQSSPSNVNKIFSTEGVNPMRVQTLLKSYCW